MHLLQPTILDPSLAIPKWWNIIIIKLILVDENSLILVKYLKGSELYGAEFARNNNNRVTEEQMRYS